MNEQHVPGGQDPHPFTIRRARRSDFLRLGAIETVCDAQFPAGRFPGAPGMDNVSKAALEAGLDAGLLWAADLNGAAVGFALAVSRGEVLHLRQLAVLPACQRQGMGRALVARVSETASALGAAEVTLTTFKDIPWNAPWYEKLGFEAVDEAGLSEELREELDAERNAGMDSRIAMRRKTAGIVY